MKKRLITLSLVLLMILSLAACGGEAAPEASEPDESTNPVSDEQTPDTQYDTKTMAYFAEYLSDGSYTMETKTEYGGMTSVMRSAYDGGSIYSESETNGTKSIVIMKDNYQYILDPSSKTCIKLSAEAMQDVQEVFSDSMDSYAAALSTGSMEIAGKSYDYEEFSVEGATAKYCFDGDDLKYIISEMDGETYTLEILSLEKGADPSLFEVPGDYTITEY